jgi:hypothetical protein
VLGHVKTLAAFLFWILLVRVHALLFAAYPSDYSPALVVSASLAIIAVLLVFAYPPATPAWRTIVLAMLLSGIVGAAAYRLAPDTRLGMFLAFAAGVLTVAARCNGNGRRLWRRLRA